MQPQAIPSAAEPPQRWPEALRDEPRPEDPFPWRVILPWVAGSAALLALLLAMWGYLNWRAGHQILFLNQAGSLVAMRADGSDARPVTFASLGGARFGPPQWAHDGQRFAALAQHDGVTDVVVARQGSDTPVLVRSNDGRLQSLPIGAWSPDDSRLAVVAAPAGAGGSALFLIDPAQLQAIPSDAHVIPRTPLAWHPRESRLLVSSYTTALTTTLRIVGPDGKSSEFAPPDQQSGRSFGAWSSDGSRIAYVATTDRRENNLRGGIWVANGDGGSPQQIVKEGLNLAPIWSPAGDAIFFTRWLTETDSYDLYRVAPDGSAATRIGAGTPAASAGPPVLAWSPDRSKLIFQSYDSSTSATTIWIANGDGSNPQPVLSRPAPQGYLIARWAPTGRALLLVTPDGNIVLHWIDMQRAETRLAAGVVPDWQP